MRKRIFILVAILGALLAGFVCVRFYSYVFAKTVRGEVMRVERVSPPGAIIAGGEPVPPAQIFSFAIAVRGDEGEIHTASSEDRQWAIVSEKQCVQAKLFPYPPWNLDKGGTYFNARLERIYDCPAQGR